MSGERALPTSIPRATSEQPSRPARSGASQACPGSTCPGATRPAASAHPGGCTRGQRVTHSTATTPKSTDAHGQEAGTSPEGHNRGLNGKEASEAPAKGIPISNREICIPREDLDNLNPQSSRQRMHMALHTGHQHGARFSSATLPFPFQRAALTCPRSWWS